MVSLKHFFSGIRWKLVVSYIVVTLVTILTLEGIVTLLLSNLDHSLIAVINNQGATSTLEPSEEFINTTLLLSTLILLPCIIPLGIIFGFITSGGITRRLRHLTEVSGALAEGNLSRRAEDSSDDEIGQLAQQFNSMADQIQTDTEQLRDLVGKNAQLVMDTQELAALKERHRLARDLHDGVKQHLFGTNLAISAALNLIDNDLDATRRKLHEAKETSGQAQEEMLTLLKELRPAGLDERGFIKTLIEFLASYEERQKVDVDLKVNEDIGLPAAYEEALFRVVQEAFSNITRHAQASKVGVELAETAGTITMKISDNGIGFDPGLVQSTNTMGLRGMKERVEGIGGKLVIDSILDSGTNIIVTLPIPEEKEGD